MKFLHFISSVLAIFLLLASCCKEPEQTEPVSLGEISVDLDANKNHIRTEESLIGNLVADAFMDYAFSKGKQVDFALVNSGNIRFNPETRPSGIYPAGLFTGEMVDEMLPFGDFGEIVKVTGTELKEIFERSVAQLPEAKGPFLQLSEGVKIEVDLSKQRQIIDETLDPEVIVTPGKRIVSIKINSNEIDSLKEYTLFAPDFITLGNDGYVTFFNIPETKKESLGEDISIALKNYIILNSPVTPFIEGRITFK